jgi:hypothetical protein
VSSREAAGIGVFIVKVDLETERVCGALGEPPEVEPCLAEIFRHETRAGMDERTAEASVAELLESFGNAMFGHFAVPSP